MDVGRYPVSSVWESLTSCFLPVELEDIKKCIGPEAIDENQELWNELQMLRFILKDLHAFDQPDAESFEYPLHCLPLNEDSCDSPSQQSQSFNAGIFEVVIISLLPVS